MDRKRVDDLLAQKLNSMEEDLKQAMEFLFDVYAQKMLVEYLLLLKEEKDIN